MRGFKWIFSLSCLVSLAGPPAQAEPPSGPYAVGVREMTLERADRTTFPALIYYPARQAGTDQPLAAHPKPWPAIVFAHGYFYDPLYLRGTLEYLTSQGYILIAPRSSLEFIPSSEKFARELHLAVDYLVEENARPDAWLYHQIDPQNLNMLGYSFGGGVSILATTQDKRIKSLATIAPLDVRPSVVAVMPQLDVPWLMITGTADRIVPYRDHGERFHKAATHPWQMVTLQGAWHCGFMEQAVWGCDPPVMDGEQQRAVTRQLLAGFFRQPQASVPISGIQKLGVAAVYQAYSPPGKTQNSLSSRK